MERFISWHYWFNLRPEPLTTTILELFAVFVFILITISIYSRFVSTRSGVKNGLWLKIFNFSFINSFLGMLLLFSNYQIIPFFTARFFLVLWAIIMIFWLFSMTKEFKKIPEKLKEEKKQDEFKKYLP